MKPKYTYAPRGGLWCVYEEKYNERGSVGAKIAEFPTKEEARAEVYRLNKWKRPNNDNRTAL